MGSAKEYSTINTKISSMKKILLKDIDYKYLLENNDFNYLIEYLFDKELIKSKEFKNIAEIESSLKKQRYSYLKKLLLYLNEDNRNLVELILDKYYIEDIKKAARNITNGNSEVEEGFIIRKDFSDSIKENISLEDFLESLRNTKFYEYIKGYKSQDNENILFFIEMRLDINYFNNIYNQGSKLKKEDRDIVKSFYGQAIDLYNINWIYRAKNFYDLEPILIYNYSINEGELFDSNDIRKLSYENIEEFIEKILETKYKFLFDSEYDIDIYMERRINRYLYYNSKKFIENNKFNLSKLLGFIIMTDFDIKDIGTILETKNFQMDIDSAKRYLIKNIGRGE